MCGAATRRPPRGTGGQEGQDLSAISTGSTDPMGSRGSTGADTVEAVLRAVVSRHLDVDPARLVSEAALGDDLCIDSLDAAELVVVVGDELGTELPDDVLDGVRTYGDLTRAVAARLQG